MKTKQKQINKLMEALNLIDEQGNYQGYRELKAREKAYKLVSDFI